MIKAIFTIIFFVGAVYVFIISNVELWNEYGKKLYEEIKKSTETWYKTTRFYMWKNNKKNKVEILSERKYKRLTRNGITCNIII